ncbi:MAG: MATE family efflux transporter [Candidatus Edwardsbacteria bacterium]|nr:MATE family efflux transporter [Candidatus Edwardsbacteria bacterium]
MAQHYGKDLTCGSIPRHLISLAVPMLVANLLNAGYAVINTIWVGNIVGPDAVGATAVSFPIFFILIAVAAGATMAVSILVAQYYGAKNHAMVARVVNTSFAFFLILGALLTAAGILATDKLLRLMDTPPEIFPQASQYMKISLFGLTFIFMFFMITAILRGIGDTVTPLVFLGVSAGINAILDPLLIIGIGPFPKLGLNGAAYASVFSQGIAFVAALIYLNKKGAIVRFRTIKLDPAITGLIFKIGFPSMIQQSLVAIGAAFITAFVNRFGAQATAAFGAAMRIEALAIMPAMSMSMAVTALAGQNLGAGKPERVKEIFRAGVLMSLAVTAAVSLSALAAPKLLLSMFVHESEVLAIGANYLRIVGAGYLLFAVMLISNGIINGSGHTLVTMTFALVALWVVRVPAASYLAKTRLGLNGIWLAVLGSFASWPWSAWPTTRRAGGRSWQ